MTLKEWLYSIGKTQVWLSGQLGENIRTVNSWATARSNIPQRHERKLRTMGFQGSLKHVATVTSEMRDSLLARRMDRHFDELKTMTEAKMQELLKELQSLNSKIRLLMASRAKKTPHRSPRSKRGRA